MKIFFLFSYVALGTLFSIQVKAQDNSFSLKNTYAKNVLGNDFTLENTGVVGDGSFGKVVHYKDGGWFQGAFSNGRRSAGSLHYPNGDVCHGHFDSNGDKNGLCLYIWSDGEWLYANFLHGVKHGEGSTYVNGAYYDFVYNQGKRVSFNRVTNPKYNKSSFDESLDKLKIARAEAAMQESTSSESSSNSRKKSSYKSPHGHKACRVCFGTGKCNTCSGKGHYYTMGGQVIRCTSCAHTGKCSSCNGTGKKIGYIGR